MSDNIYNAQSAPKIRVVQDQAHVPKNNNPKILIIPKQPQQNPAPYNQNIQTIQQPNQQYQQPTQQFPSFGQQQQPQFQPSIYNPQNNFPSQQNQPQNLQFMPQNFQSKYNDQSGFPSQQSPVKQDNPYLYNPQHTQQNNYQQEKSNMMFPSAAGVMHFDSNRSSLQPIKTYESPIYEQKSYLPQKQEPQNVPFQTQQQKQLPSWQLTDLERDELSIRVLNAFQQADENRRQKQRNR